MLVGIWLQVSYAVLLCVMVPVAVCWVLTGPVLQAVHKIPQEVSDASYYALVPRYVFQYGLAFHS